MTYDNIEPEPEEVQTPIEVEVKLDSLITTQDGSSVTPDDAHELHEWDRYEGEIDDPVTVCVMDSGISEQCVDNHEWFENATLSKQHDVTGSGVGSDAIGHGTGCASIIAKNTPAVELYDLRIFGNTGRTGFREIEEAYNWIVDHADEIDIVNMSWGSTSNIPALNRLHQNMLSEGVCDVVAAGNTGRDGGSPATATNAFSAGAVDGDGNLTRFSSSNPNRDNPDVVAVGKDVLMARAPNTSMGRVIDENFVKASGTSFSAPYTVAAYVNAYYRERSNWNRRFEIGSEDIEGIAGDGDGLLKLQNALAVDAEKLEAGATVWAFNDKDVMYIDADWMNSKDTNVEKLEETDKYLDVRIKK